MYFLCFNKKNLKQIFCSRNMHLFSHSGLGVCLLTLFLGPDSVVGDSLFYVTPIVCGGICWFLFCYAYLSVLSSFDEEELVAFLYSKTCLKLPLKKKTKNGFQDRLLFNAGQKYYRMLPLAFCNTFDLH